MYRPLMPYAYLVELVAPNMVLGQAKSRCFKLRGCFLYAPALPSVVEWYREQCSKHTSALYDLCLRYPSLTPSVGIPQPLSNL